MVICRAINQEYRVMARSYGSDATDKKDVSRSPGVIFII